MWLHRFLKGNLCTYILFSEIYLMYILQFIIYILSFLVSYLKLITKLDCHGGKQKKNSKIDVEELPLHELQLLKEPQTISIYCFYLLHNHVDTSAKSK